MSVGDCSLCSLSAVPDSITLGFRQLCMSLITADAAVKCRQMSGQDQISPAFNRRASQRFMHMTTESFLTF